MKKRQPVSALWDTDCRRVRFGVGVGIVVKMAVSQFCNTSAGGGARPLFATNGAKALRRSASRASDRTHREAVYKCALSKLRE
ncbi:MAG TPA: hypothetical protein VFD23_01385 [Clostridia bacterium]|nr:hypothetical protein [Clostridia bacterium]